jgi:hypothetical protein
MFGTFSVYKLWRLYAWESHFMLVRGWAASAKVSAHECAVLIGTLNHCSAVVIAGWSHLASLYHFASKFSVSFSCFELHTVPASVASDIIWWRDHLSSTWCSLSIMTPPSPHPAPIFVDASTSFGIGFWWDNHWLAWCFWRVGIVRAGILVGWK